MQGMDNATLTPERSALKMRDAKPKAPKKRTDWRWWAIPAAALVLLVGGILVAPYAQAHVADAITPTVTAADTIASEAQTLDEEYATTCSDPAWNESYKLTNGTGSGEVMDGITGTCTALGQKGQEYVAAVETSTSIWTNIGDGFGEVTDNVKAAVESGDIETAIRILFAQSETEAGE